MVFDFPVMAGMQTFRDEDRNVTLCLSHGHVFSPDSLPPLPDGSVFFSGHTHVLLIEKRGGVTCVNPGSVSLPKQENPKSYATYCDGKIEIKTLDGDVLLSQSI